MKEPSPFRNRGRAIQLPFTLKSFWFACSIFVFILPLIITSIRSAKIATDIKEGKIETFSAVVTKIGVGRDRAGRFGSSTLTYFITLQNGDMYIRNGTLDVPASEFEKCKNRRLTFQTVDEELVGIYDQQTTYLSLERVLKVTESKVSDCLIFAGVLLALWTIFMLFLFCPRPKGETRRAYKNWKKSMRGQGGKPEPVSAKKRKNRKKQRSGAFPPNPPPAPPPPNEELS